MSVKKAILRPSLLLVVVLTGTSMAWSTDPPVLVSPAHGATDQAVLLTLSWNAVAFADSYQVQLADDSLFETIIVNRTQAHVAVTLQSTSVGPLEEDSTYYWRVRTKDGSGTLSAWSAFRRFRTITAKPGVPTLSAPTNNATNTALTDTLRWNVDAIAEGYRIQVATASTFAPASLALDTLVAVQSGAQIQRTPLRGLVNKTRYYWRVHSRKGSDSSAWSTVWNFTTIVDTPAVPVLGNPVDGAMSQAVNPTAFSWTAVPDAQNYRLQIATDPGFTSLVYNDSALTGTSKQVSGLLNATTYYWRMSAKNIAGTSALSAARSFSTRLAQPGAVSPASGALNTPIQLVLQWSTVPGASSYRIQVSTASTFTTVLHNSVVTGDTFSLTGLANKTKYYWRVSARASSGDSSVYPTTAWSFTTIVDTPAIPVLGSPADGAKSQPVPPTLAWTAATDAAQYHLQVALDSQFQAIVYNDSSLTGVSKQVAGLVANSRYFWRVRSRNLAAPSEFSAVWSFTTRPAAPAVVTPANGGTNIAVSPLLSWTPVDGAVSYRVQLSAATGFSPLLIDAVVTADTVRAGPLANKTKYYWRVSARNANGDTSAFPATAWNFTTIVAGAGEPVLAAPLDGARSIQPGAAALSWNAVPDASSYRLQVSADPAFASAIIDDSTITTTSRSVTTLHYASQYFWRVSAKNAAGMSPWSETRSFTTALALPSVVAPVTGALDQLVEPTLRWSAVAGAGSYLVQVARTSQFRPLLTEVLVSSESVTVGPYGNDSVYYWRVSARGAAGDTSILPSSGWTFRTKIATPFLNQPLTGAVDQPVNPVLSWLASPAAATYRLQVSEDPSFPGTVVFDDATITGTSRQIGPLASSRTYYWRVNARNAAGTSTSLWSETRSLTTRIDTPAVPVLVSPADGAQDQQFSPTLVWNTAIGAAYYGLQVAVDSLFTQIVFERSPLIATSFQIDPLPSNSRFYWRVRATNSTGSATSAYSPPRTFRTMLEKPAVPALYAPASRSMIQPLTPTLRWSSFTSSEWYRVQVSTDSYFPSAVLDTTGVIDTVLAIPASAGLTHNTVYYWRVKGLNRLDSSAFALPFNFTTGIAVPVPTHPAKGATDYSPANVAFEWQPVPGARTYGFRLALDSALTAVVRADSGLPGTSITVDSLSVSMRYYWQVSARSDSNGATRSPVWSFTTLITVPGIPQLITPAPVAVNLPTSVSFQWQPSLGANSYRLQISTDSSFGTVLYDFPALSATSHQVTSLAYNTTYHWRVNASNGNGPSAWSERRRFTVTVPPPAVPALLAPPDGQTEVGLPVMLSWGQTGGATSYRVRISSTPDFSTVVFDSTTTDNWLGISSVAYGARFYWQVTAINAGGMQSSAVWNFTTRISAPAVPVLATPPNGTINTAVNVALVWGGATGAAGYHIQVARDSVFSILLVNDSTVTEPGYALAGLDGYTRYFWRVRAKNAGGSSAYAFPWSFRTTIGTPTVIAPLQAALHEPHATVFRWHRLPSPAAYRLQLSRAPDFLALDLDVAGITDTVYQAPRLPGFTRFYWRVIARSPDGSSTSAPSDVRYYTTVLDTPAIIAPLSDLTEQPVTMTFRWRRSAYAESYRLEVATDEAFASLRYVDSTALDTLRIVGPIEGLTTYWWRLRAQNPADASSYTAARRFTTTIATPELRTPPNAEQFAPLSPELTWLPVPGAARYRIQVATDTLMTALVSDDSLVSGTSKTIGPLPRLMKHYWRVRAKSADGRSIGAWSPVWSFRTVPQPPAPTILLAPLHASVDQPRTVPMRWRRATGAETYGLEVAGDSLFTQIILTDSTITDTLYQPPVLAGLWKHYWRVRSINPGGSSPFTMPWMFTTILGTPVPVSPAYGVPDQPVAPRIVWTRVPRAATYRMQLSTDSLFRSTVFDDSTLADTGRTITGLARSTTYFWRVRARAAGGISTSTWSPAQRFITVPDPPATPALSLPVAGARNVPVNATFSWSNAARAARYHFQLAADSLFEFIIFQDSTLADTLKQVDSLDHFAAYHWRVRAWNVGGSSAWSGRRQFLTTLSQPVALTPPPDAQDQPVSVLLSWTASKGAARYRLVLSSDSLLRSPLVDDSTVTQASRIVSGLAFSTPYFWRVTARTADGTGISTPSAIRKFTTIIERPPLPGLVSPGHLSEGVPAAEPLVWSAAARAERYHLQLSADSGFTQLRVNDSTITDTVHLPSGLAPHTPYWWRVRAGNRGGFSSYSSIRRYTTSIATPDPVAPPDSATDVGATISMRWTASPGATSYTLEVSTSPLFTAFAFRDSFVTGTTRDVSGLEPFMRYYWRVKAVDERGAGAYSPVAMFVTRLVAPVAPLQDLPASGSASLLTTQTFRWHPGRLAESYQVQIATDSPFDSTVFDQTGIRDTFLTVTTLGYNTRYFWRVRGTNAEGNGSYSSVWSFTTVVAPPATPVLSAPASASADQPPLVRFTWRPSAHARHYHVQVAGDPSFAQCLVNDSTVTDTLLSAGPFEYTHTYYWRIRAINADWTTAWSPVWSMRIMAAPVVYDLFQNYPNPANPSTVIRYDVPAEATVVLTLYNLLGQTVRELVNEVQKAGRYEYTLDGGGLPSGVYFYRITATSLGLVNGQPAAPVDPFVATRKCVIVK